MLEVASLELCKELYELSGWSGTLQNHYKNVVSWASFSTLQKDAEENNETEPVPAYSLGYLLRKLPHYINTHDARGTFELFIKKTQYEYHAGYNKPELGKWLDDNNHGVWNSTIHADTPEDVAAKLCVELFKQNILTKE